MNFSDRRVLTFAQGCEYIGFKPSYVYKLTASGILPFSKPHGKKIFFEKEKLEQWMLSNSRTSLAEKQVEATTFVKTRKNG